MDLIQKSTIEEVYLALNTRPGGLSPEEVKKRAGTVREKPDTLIRLLFWVKKVTRQFRVYSLFCHTALGGRRPLFFCGALSAR